MWHFKYGLIFIKTYDRMTFENVTCLTRRPILFMPHFIEELHASTALPENTLLLCEDTYHCTADLLL